MAAILGPGGPSTAIYFAADGPGDHLWHDRSFRGEQNYTYRLAAYT